jgi:hypothetical protein
MRPRSRPIVKILITAVCGLIAYLLAAVSQMSLSTSVLLAIVIGASALVAQVLGDFEQRLNLMEAEQRRSTALIRAEIKNGFDSLNQATELFALVESSALAKDSMTQLVRNAVGVRPTAPPVTFNFARSEVGRVSDLLRSLGQGDDVVYEGEDRDWLLALAASAAVSIESTSIARKGLSSDGLFDAAVWETDFGLRYLDAQVDAVRRGVAVRRVFVLQNAEVAADAAFQKVLGMHLSRGLEVRVLDATGLLERQWRATSLEFILFDATISYETVPATAATLGSPGEVVVNTHLTLRPERVRERVARFEELWSSARHAK